MPRSSRVRSRRHVHPALLLLALLGIVSMPVDYRGGASIPHPHATLQLLSDLARDSHDHHSPPVEQPGHGREDHRPGRHGQVPTLASISTISTWAGEPHRHQLFSPALVATLAKLVDGVSDGPTIDDAPSLTPRTGRGSYGAFQVLLPAIVASVVTWVLLRLTWVIGSAWAGVAVAPETPPPRRAGLRHAPA